LDDDAIFSIVLRIFAERISLSERIDMNGIWEFIKRNIFTIVLIATLIVAMPWLGYIFVVPIILIIAFGMVVSWQVYRLRKRMYDEIRNQQGEQQQQQQQQRWWQRYRNRQEGEVTIVQTEQTEQKVSDDVGEYVEFKEITNKKE
jgi:hypothetical protein